MSDTDLYYRLDSPKLGSAVIINNLNTEQEPTRRDVDSMAQVLCSIGFQVSIHCDLTSQGMNNLKRTLTNPDLHRNSSCFLLLIISHGTEDNFLQDTHGAKTWNIESLVTEVCDVVTLVGKPKLFFIEACRGREHNMGRTLASGLDTKSLSGPPRTQGISLPSKQDVFVGFATVPGFVSFTSSLGSPYLQALASMMSAHHSSTHLSDIHLLVKRRLAGLQLGREGARQGAEERSSLLSKLLFSRASASVPGSITMTNCSVDSPVWCDSPMAGISPMTVAPSPSLAPITIPIQRESLTSTKKDAGSMLDAPSPTPISPLSEDRILSGGGLEPHPRHSLFSFPYSSSFPSTFTPCLSISPTPRVFAQDSHNSTVYNIEIRSTQVEAGLQQLLDRVTELYGGEGKVKVRRKLWSSARGEEEGKKKYSFKYLGPEKAAVLLEKALWNVKELQGKSDIWKFTQRLEVSQLSQ